jgi:hypothetical protein
MQFFFYLFLVSWGGVRLCPLGMSATNWPIVAVPALVMPLPSVGHHPWLTLSRLLVLNLISQGFG